jgi:hypothetical protein
MKPKFPRKGAADKEVIDNLRLLVTHRAALRMREASVCQTIRGPAAIMGNKPQKEGALGRSPTFGYSLLGFLSAELSAPTSF